MPYSKIDYAAFKADVQFVCEKMGIDFDFAWRHARTAGINAIRAYHQLAHSYREQQQ